MKTTRVFAIILSVIITMFGCFSLAENYFVWNILGTQLEIGIKGRINSSFSEKKKSTNVLDVQQNNIYRKQYDLISALDRASGEEERLAIIDDYISGLSSSIADSSKIYESEMSQVDFYNSQAKECESQIKGKNAEFSEAVQNYDFDKSEIVMEEIAQLRSCVAKNQVYAKAHTSYASISRSADNLQKRADYLSEHRVEIAKYYEVLKPDLMKELYKISQTINANF